MFHTFTMCRFHRFFLILHDSFIYNVMVFFPHGFIFHPRAHLKSEHNTNVINLIIHKQCTKVLLDFSFNALTSHSYIILPLLFFISKLSLAFSLRHLRFDSKGGKFLFFFFFRLKSKRLRFKVVLLKNPVCDISNSKNLTVSEVGTTDKNFA